MKRNHQTRQSFSNDLEPNRKKKKTGIAKERERDYLRNLANLNESFASWAKALREQIHANPSSVEWVDHQIFQYTRHVEFMANHYHDERLGKVYTFGLGDCGQLGISEDVTDTSQPLPVEKIDEKVIQMTCGGLHTIALGMSGNVYAWGCHDDGSLGTGILDDNIVHKPTKISLEGVDDGDRVRWVAAGNTQTLILLESGVVHFCGAYKDSDGTAWKELGPSNDPEKKNQLTVRDGSKIPRLISHLSDVQTVSCGAAFNAAILRDWSVVTWGIGKCGELGRPVPPMKNGHEYDEKAIEQKYLKALPPIWQVGPPQQVLRIACGDYHLLVITQHMRVAATGLNNYGQLGLGDELNREKLNFVTELDGMQVKEIDGGHQHSLCLTSDGLIYAFGRGDSGELGITDSAPPAGFFKNVPQRVLMPNDDASMPNSKTTISKISCGDHHNMVLSESGSLYSWGYGDMGMLGHGVEKDAYRPTLVKKNLGKIHQIAAGGQHSALLIGSSSGD